MATASDYSGGLVRNLQSADEIARSVESSLNAIEGLPVEADGATVLKRIDTDDTYFESVETAVNWEDLAKRLRPAKDEGRLGSLQDAWEVLTGPKICF